MTDKKLEAFNQAFRQIGSSIDQSINQFLSKSAYIEINSPMASFFGFGVKRIQCKKASENKETRVSHLHALRSSHKIRHATHVT